MEEILKALPTNTEAMAKSIESGYGDYYLDETDRIYVWSDDGAFIRSKGEWFKLKGDFVDALEGDPRLIHDERSMDAAWALDAKLSE